MVGEDADVGGDLHGLPDDLDGRHIGMVDEGSRRGESEISAGANRQNSVFIRLHEIAVAGHEKALLLVGDDHLGLQLT